MTIKQYVKSLNSTIRKNKELGINNDWYRERLRGIKGAIIALGEKEVKALSANVISGKVDQVSIDFFVLCWESARDHNAPYTVWDDDRMNNQAVKIYKKWREYYVKVC